MFSLRSLANLPHEHQPITLRGLFYRVVSTGYFPDTDKKYYAKLGNLMSTLRRERWIPYEWIVDNIRSTIKPSSWSGLDDFVDTVSRSYRKDFWSSLPDYIHIFIEKDAMSGIVAPVTQEYDLSMSPIRGYVSDSYVHSLGTQWRQIEKPIHVFYMGDFDPSGFDLERDLADKLVEHSGRLINSDNLPFNEGGLIVNSQHADPNANLPWCTWERLALNEDDFDNHDLFEIKPKQKDSRSKRFIERFGERCAEVDALEPREIRRRVREAIEQYIPTDEWERLKKVESVERETFQATLGGLV